MHYDANQATPAMTLTSTLDGNDQLDARAGPAGRRSRRHAFRSRGRIRRHGAPALRRWRQWHAAEVRQRLQCFLSRWQRDAGNIGADTLVLCTDPRIDRCTNPLPAVGGTDPETMDQIRRRAPQAFMTQERAVTMADYERVTEMNTQVQNAVATLRWTGSWYTVFITAEPQGRRPDDARRCASSSSATSTAIAWRDRTSNSSRRSMSRCRLT